MGTNLMRTCFSLGVERYQGDKVWADSIQISIGPITRAKTKRFK